MEIQQRIIKFVIFSNWIVFCFASLAGFTMAASDIALGIVSGGLIVTINFHLLARTLKKSFNLVKISSPNTILIKYYFRFIVSGLIIFFLITKHYVNPIGLFVGLSVVVVSITLATICELTRLVFKEAV